MQRITTGIYRSFCTSNGVAGAAKKYRKVIKVGEKRPVVMTQREVNQAHEAKAASMGLEFRTVGARYVIFYHGGKLLDLP